jgi:hypothetical protein
MTHGGAFNSELGNIMALNDITVLQEQANGSLKETLLTPSIIGAAPTSHTHPASAISDSTGSGRTLLTSNLVSARAHLSLFPSFANRAAFPATGDVDRVYTALDTSKIYVWVPSSSTYVEVSPQVKADWNATSGDAEILNKPALNFAPTNLVGSPIEFVIACSDETTALTSGVAKVTFRAPVAFRLTDVSASVTAAPTGSPLIVDINQGGNSVLTSPKLNINAGTLSSRASSSPPSIIADYRDIGQEGQITIDIDQVGSTVAGKGLKVVLIGTRI